jgi:hypothetical protein
LVVDSAPKTCRGKEASNIPITVMVNISRL